MSHEVETMAYANQVPWHGLGNNVDVNVSIEEMQVAAGLDWSLSMHPMFAHVDGKPVRIPNKSALIRSSDNAVLTTASDNWKFIQPKQVLEFFRDYAFAGGATLETAGSLKGGKVIWGLANLGHGFTVGNGKDHVRGHLLFMSPNEMGKASIVRPTATRVVCANTMAVALAGVARGEYRQNHLTDFDFDKAKETIGLAHESMHRAELNAQALEQLKLSEFDTVRVLSKFFQPAKEGTSEDSHVKMLLEDAQSRTQPMHEVLLSVEQAPGATPGTGWGVMNGVTFWSDHVAGRSADARLAKAWFGENANLKMEVEKELLALAA